MSCRFLSWRRVRIQDFFGSFEPFNTRSLANSLFKFYPDPDPASPKSIFYKWNKLPQAKKAFGKINNTPERSAAQIEAYKTVYQQMLTAEQRRRVESR